MNKNKVKTKTQVKKKKEQIDFERWGLFIGINKYEDSSFSNLKYAMNDAVDISKTLTDKEIGGVFEPDNVITITDHGRSASELPLRSNVYSSFSNICENAEKEDEIYIYFSGHGMEFQECNYIICFDTKYSYIDETAIKLSWLKERLNQSKARLKTMIFDACHAGADIKGVKNVMSKDFYREMTDISEGMIMMSSCKQNELSWEIDKEKHGVFTHYLILGLKGSADSDKDGKINLNDLYSYTNKNVRRWASRNNKVQTPTLETKIAGDVLLIDKSLIVEEQITTEERISGFYPFSIKILSKTGNLQDIIDNFLLSRGMVCADLLTSKIGKKPSDINFVEDKKIPQITFPNGAITIQETAPRRQAYAYVVQIDMLTPDLLNKMIKILPHISTRLSTDWQTIRFAFKRTGADLDYIYSELNKYNISLRYFIPQKYIRGEIEIKGLKKGTIFFISFMKKEDKHLVFTNRNSIFSEKINLKTFIDLSQSLLKM